MLVSSKDPGLFPEFIKEYSTQHGKAVLSRTSNGFAVTLTDGRMIDQKHGSWPTVMGLPTQAYSCSVEAAQAYASNTYMQLHLHGNTPYATVCLRQTVGGMINNNNNNSEPRVVDAESGEAMEIIEVSPSYRNEFASPIIRQANELSEQSTQFSNQLATAFYKAISLAGESSVRAEEILDEQLTLMNELMKKQNELVYQIQAEMLAKAKEGNVTEATSMNSLLEIFKTTTREVSSDALSTLKSICGIKQDQIANASGEAFSILNKTIDAYTVMQEKIQAKELKDLELRKARIETELQAMPILREKQELSESAKQADHKRELDMLEQKTKLELAQIELKQKARVNEMNQELRKLEIQMKQKMMTDELEGQKLAALRQNFEQEVELHKQRIEAARSNLTGDWRQYTNVTYEETPPSVDYQTGVVTPGKLTYNARDKSCTIS